MRSVLRVLVGFLVACLAAALTTLLFVHTPAEVVGWLAARPAGDAGARLSGFGLLWLAVVTQCVMFAAVPALLVAVLGEWRRIRDWTTYALAGLVIALLGFSAQWASEATGQGWSVVSSNYPLVAFMTTGFVAGFVYWMVAGRHAGGRVDLLAPAPVAVAEPPVAPGPSAQPEAAPKT